MAVFLDPFVLAQFYEAAIPGSGGSDDLEAKLMADHEVAMFLGGMGNLSPAKEKMAGAIITSQLKRWGGKGNDAGALLREFNNLIGVGNIANVRRATLSAACAASRAVAAQKSWKLAVAGFALRDSFPRLIDENKAKAKELLGQLSAIESQARKTSVSKPEKDPLLAKVMESYKFLGIMSEGDNLTIANYRFRILSGTSEDAGKKDLFDAATYNALKIALQSFVDGKDWKFQS